MKNVEDVYRLAPSQREMLSRRQPALETWIEHLHWSFRGPLDEATLEGAWRELVRRHAALRTAIFTQGLKEPMQVVREKVEVALERQDASLESFLAADRRRGMNLTAAPLVRLTLLRTALDAGMLVFSYHPMVLDQISARQCVGELLQLHKAARDRSEPGLERGRSCREYLAWLHQQDAGEAEARIRDTLRGGGYAQLPEREDSTALEAGAETQVQQFVLSPAATGNVQAFLRKNKLGFATLLQAAWAVLLRRHGAQGDVVFGVRVTGRPASLSRSASMTGCFENTQPRRISIPSDGTPLRWLRALQAELGAWQAYEHTPLSQIRQWLDVSEETPLFQSVVSTEELPEEDPLKPLARSLGFHGLTHAAPEPLFPLVISAVPGARLTLRFLYDARRFDAPAVARLAGQLGEQVEALSTQADQELSALTQAPIPPVSTGRISGGTGLGATELEAILAQHPWIREVSVTTEASGELVAHVVPAPAAMGPQRKLDFSLFFFADEDAGASDKYHLLLNAAKFADRNGFAAIWTPERHFHEHGGLYPNPATLAAALSTVTENIGLRAGSVVLPLQIPFRVAEEWSIVDNFSRGRAGISIASGWVPNDFAFAPENFAKKREVMFRNLEQIERLWSGETVTTRDGVGNEVKLRVFPRPVQPKLPVWVTCAGGVDLFEKTGRDGYHLLTSLLGQSLEDALEKIGIYREHLKGAGHDTSQRIATLMMHTFVGRDTDEVLDKVRAPLTKYLGSHVELMRTMAKSLNLQVDINEPQWVDYVASFAFERYYRTGALIGTPTSCLPMVDRLMAAGVDEVACFIDFGVSSEAVLESLTHLTELKRLAGDRSLRLSRLLSEYIEERLPNSRRPVTFRTVQALPIAA